MVDKETTLTFADLMSRPLVERTITLTCVSNRSAATSSRRRTSSAWSFGQS